MAKSFQRTCSVCRKKADKSELLRVVRTKIAEQDGTNAEQNEKLDKKSVFSVDYIAKSDGRGAYICKNSDCIKKCIAKKTLNRSFKCAVDNEVYLELQNYLDTLSD